jgi:hypothetical protein
MLQEPRRGNFPAPLKKGAFFRPGEGAVFYDVIQHFPETAGRKGTLYAARARGTGPASGDLGLFALKVSDPLALRSSGLLERWEQVRTGGGIDTWLDQDRGRESSRRARDGHDHDLKAWPSVSVPMKMYTVAG